MKRGPRAGGAAPGRSFADKAQGAWAPAPDWVGELARLA